MSFFFFFFQAEDGIRFRDVTGVQTCALPISLENKAKYEIPGIGGQRGYVSFGKEHAKGRSAGDLKEFWHFGQYVSEGSKYAGEYPDNVEVTELPKFNEVGKEAYQMLEKTGVYVLRD